MTIDPNEIKQVGISNADLFELASLVYKRWAQAYDDLKKVKEEKPDYKLEPDWDQFHELRLKNGTEEEAKWRAFRDRITILAPRLT